MTEQHPRRPYLPHSGEAPPLPRWHAYVIAVFAVLVFIPSVLVPLSGLTGIGVPFEGTLVGPRWPSEGFEVRSTALPELATDVARTERLYGLWPEDWIFRIGAVLAIAYVSARLWLMERGRRNRIEPTALLASAGYLVAVVWASNRLEAHVHGIWDRGDPFDELLVRSDAGVIAFGLFAALAVVGCVAIGRIVRRRDAGGGFGIAATGIGLSLSAMFWLDFGVVGAPQLRKIPESLDVDLPALEVGSLARWIPYGGWSQDCVYVQIAEVEGAPHLRLRHSRVDEGWEPPTYDGELAGDWSSALHAFARRAEPSEDPRDGRSALDTWVEMDVDHDVPFGVCRPLLLAFESLGFRGFALLHAGPGCTEVRFSVPTQIPGDASPKRPTLTLGNPPLQDLLTVGDRSYDTLESLLADPSSSVDADGPLDVLVEDEVPWSHVVQLLGAFEKGRLRFEVPQR